MKEDFYNETEWNKYNDLKKKAIEIIYSSNPEKVQVETLVDDLTDSMNKLVFNKEKEEMKRVLSQAKKIKNIGYDETRWSRFVYARYLAEKFYENDSKSRYYMKDIITNLKELMNQLEN